MKLGMIAWVFALVVFQGSAWASEISVLGRAYSATGCSHYSNSLADLSLKYVNRDLGWGTSVTVHYGFQDSFSGQAWQRTERGVAEAVGPYTWELSLASIPVDARGSFFFSDIQFAFEIHQADGSVFFDNGGRSAEGFYRAELPRRECQVPERLLPLTVQVAR